MVLLLLFLKIRVSPRKTLDIYVLFSVMVGLSAFHASPSHWFSFAFAFAFAIKALSSSHFAVDLVLCAISALVLHSLGLWCICVFRLQMSVPLSISGVCTAEFL